MPTNCPPLYSPWQVTCATLLGSAAPGLWLIANNFETIGWSEKAKTLRVVTITVFVAIAAFAIYGPELKSSMGVGVIQAILVRQYALLSYRKTYEKHLREGGLRRKHRDWILAGLLGLAILMVVCICFVFGVGAVAPDLIPQKYFE
jgi:hypothetical protein